MVQLLYGAVFYEGIGYTDTSDMGNIVIVRHELQYGTAHSSFFDTVFYGDDMLEVESHLVQQGFVERLEKTQVVVGYGDSFVLLRTLYGTCGHVAYGTEGDDCQVFAFFQSAPFAYGDFFQRTFPIQQYAASAGIADDERTLVRQLCRVHQTAQFMFVHR